MKQDSLNKVQLQLHNQEDWQQFLWHKELEMKLVLLWGKRYHIKLNMNVVELM